MHLLEYLEIEPESRVKIMKPAVNAVLATCTITNDSTLNGKYPFMMGG